MVKQALFECREQFDELRPSGLRLDYAWYPDGRVVIQPAGCPGAGPRLRWDQAARQAGRLLRQLQIDLPDIDPTLPDAEFWYMAILDLVPELFQREPLQPGQKIATGTVCDAADASWLACTEALLRLEGEATLRWEAGQEAGQDNGGGEVDIEPELDSDPGGRPSKWQHFRQWVAKEEEAAGKKLPAKWLVKTYYARHKVAIDRGDADRPKPTLETVKHIRQYLPRG